MSNQKYFARRREKLWREQGGLCHWCKRLTYRRSDPRYHRKNGRLSGLAATLDHFFGRLDPRRQDPTALPRYVMACNTCNHRRSQEQCRPAPEPAMETAAA